MIGGARRCSGSDVSSNRRTPKWSRSGSGEGFRCGARRIICTGETYKSAVKMTFARGASLQDPSGLFNSSLEGNTRRAIDFHEGDKIDEKALKALIRAAVALNTSVRATARPSALRRDQRALEAHELDEAQLADWVKASQPNCPAGQGLTTANFGSPDAHSAQLGALAPLIDWTSQWPASGKAGSTTSKIYSKGRTNEQTRDRNALRRCRTGDTFSAEKDLARTRCANVQPPTNLTNR